MPHFKDDDNITSDDNITNDDNVTNDDNITNDESMMRKWSNTYYGNTECIADGENMSLDVEFAELKAILPNYASVEVSTQGFEGGKKANSIDLEDPGLADLHRQTSILSSAIDYIRYLELCREYLRQENKIVQTSINNLRESIRSFGTIERREVDRDG
jgi:hypothetical protein